MSKAAAIHTAITLEMAADGKDALDRRGRLADPAAAPRYTADTFRGFLAKVALRLRADTPPLAFEWSKIPDAYLNQPLWLVEDAIANVTSEISQAAPKAG